ncbi:hypothetical protein LF1_23600 [Rubripirellula obstinata]|uniref:Uncharacterized protein n=1 Tax=Rubripirellula obstinata TaxID=406547 RepID=A0A5B1CK93_9BACT|nr:hypothetical protein LF1_23600 [Rubripirellula obstinata]
MDLGKAYANTSAEFDAMAVGFPSCIQPNVKPILRFLLLDPCVNF